MALHYSCAPVRLGSAAAAPTVGRHRFCTASFRASAVSSAPKARFVARRTESTTVQQLQRPLAEYMSLPASQYSVLDAERIERIDDNTFRCYVYRIKFFAFEFMQVARKPLTLIWYGNAASMVNRVSCNDGLHNSTFQQLATDTVIEVTIDIPFAFRAIPVEVFESTGTQVLEQLLRLMLPRFLAQLVKDYQSWASGDNSRQPLGTGQI
ncbi:hypothetical protein C4D60_Mb04t36210 [Musa balbisiana]|uniref:DUF1997 domain-containing protein n=1 Tax=Musa balbisiana TaxID=52838 RepID=A0A4V6T4T8_MUSBA|nr:hypothetical protein C4D60_Mb04t36210 [Musa balbisiana]